MTHELRSASHYFNVKPTYSASSKLAAMFNNLNQRHSYSFNIISQIIPIFEHNFSPELTFHRRTNFRYWKCWFSKILICVVTCVNSRCFKGDFICKGFIGNYPVIVCVRYFIPLTPPWRPLCEHKPKKK